MGVAGAWRLVVRAAVVQEVQAMCQIVTKRLWLGEVLEGG